jgi:hypothetical protein
MRRLIITITAISGLAYAGFAPAGDHADMIASAESAGPPSVTASATIKASDGTVLREGTNEYTCYPGSESMGAMCNPPEWDEFMAAFMAKEEFTPGQMSVSYMLAGDVESQGVSNSDPFHPDPPSADDFVVEGPHLMILVPDKSMLEGISRDPSDPVYVMWADTPFAHIMVKIGN